MQQAKIIIAEDDVLQADLISEKLSAFGYTVVGIVKNGRNLLTEVKKTNPDILLLDIRLKGEIDGIEAAKSVLAERALPVVFLSAFSDETVIQRALLTHPYAYITKPFTDAELAANIHLALYSFSLEQELRSHDEKLSSILNMTPDIIYRLDKEGKISFINEAVERYGHRSSELIGKPIEYLLDFEGRDDLKLQATERRSGSRKTTGLRVRLKTADGDSPAAELDESDGNWKNGFLMDAEGIYPDNQTTGENYIGTQGIIRDISRELEAEKVLKEEEEKYRRLFEDAFVALCEVDINEVLQDIELLKTEGIKNIERFLDLHPEYLEQELKKAKIVDVNKRMMSLFAAEKKSDLLTPLENRLSGEFLPFTKDLFTAIFREERFYSGDTRVKAFDGRELDLLVRLTIPQNGYGHNNLLVSMMDISSRRRIEEDLQKKGRYLQAIVLIQQELIQPGESGHSYRRIMRILGETTGALRSYLYRCIDDPADPYRIRLLADWFPSEDEENNYRRKTAGLESFKIREKWVGRLKQGDIIHGLISDFDDDIQEILAEIRTASVLWIPLFVENQFWGFIGFNNDLAIPWSESEINLLQSVVSSIELFIARTRSQSDLISSEEKYRSLFQLAGEAILIINAENGSIWDANDAASQLFGYKVEELRGNSAFSFLEVETPHKSLRQWKSETTNSDVYRFESRCRTKTGEEIDLSISSRFLVIKGDDYLLLILRNITERRRYERALTENERLYRQMFERPGLAKLLIDPENESIIDANQAACDFYGYSKKELTSLKLGDVIDYQAEEVRFRLNRIREKQWPRFSSRHVLADGTKREVLVYTALIERMGKELIFSTVIDQTDRLHAERQVKQSRELILQMGQETSLSGALEVMLRELKAMEEFDSGAVILFEPLSREQFVISSYGISQDFLAQEKQLHAIYSVRNRDKLKQVICYSLEELENFSHYKHFLNEGIRSAAVVRIRHRQKSLGLLFLASHSLEKISPYTKADLEALLAGTGSIIARFKAEEALRRSEQRFKELADNLNVFFWMRDVKSNTVIYASSAFQSILERPVSDFYDDPDIWFKVIHPEDKIAAREKIEKNSIENSMELNYRALMPDGKIKWLKSYSFPLRDAEGKVVRLGGFIEDISNQRHQQERMEWINQCLLQFGTDCIENINRLTRLAGELFGGISAVYDRLEDGKLKAVGQWNMPKDFAPEGLAKGHICDHVVRNTQGEACVFRNLGESDYVKTDPNVKRYGIQTYFGRAIGFSGKQIGALCVLFDHDFEPTEEDERFFEIISSALGLEEERYAVEKELEKARIKAELASRAKSDFLANMSHELRTPLHGVLGYTQILQRAPNLKYDQREHLATIQNMGTHLLTMINDILDYSRLEADRLELQPGLVNVDEFFREINRVMVLKAEEKSLSLETKLDPELPSALLIDEKRLRQVLFNLIGNAIKFTNRGKVELSVEMTQENIRFSVKDTGPGIEEDDLEAIFDPFRQIDREVAKAEGAGLGLTISRHILHLMGSQLEVESTVGEGSTFSFEFPKSIASDHPSMELDKMRINGYTGPRKTILVLDDREENRILLEDLLVPLGFTVYAPDPTRVDFKKLMETDADAILVDLLLPNKLAFSFIEKIRRSDCCADAVIIGTSSDSSESAERLSKEAGCDYFIRRPFQLRQLSELLQKALGFVWIDKEARGEEAKVYSDEEIQAPPLEELDILSEYAMDGDVFSLEKELDRLEQDHPYAAGFVRHARNFVKDLNMNAMVDFIHSLKEHIDE